MFFLKLPERSDTEKFLSGLKSSPYSYKPIGETRHSGRPSRFLVDHRRILVGKGEASFQRAKEALRRWEMFSVPNTKICFPNTPLRENEIVAVFFRFFGIWFRTTSRIVYTMEETTGPSHRFGFAYGTLPAHVESGEERFMVEWVKGDNTVWYDLYAFSHPARWWTYLGFPLVRRMQLAFAKKSCAAIQRFVESAP